MLKQIWMERESVFPLFLHEKKKKKKKKFSTFAVVRKSEFIKQMIIIKSSSAEETDYSLVRSAHAGLKASNSLLNLRNNTKGKAL